jgi:hypothetical protein
MRRIAPLLVAAGGLACVVAQMVPASGQGRQVPASVLEAPPPGYRDWRLISVAHEEGSINDIRAILGNDVAIEAIRDGKLPYPNGSIIARLAWSYDPLEESSKAFGHPQSFVAGAPKNGVQFMVKDTIKYASTGDWGFIQFNDGRPADNGTGKACYSCHAIVNARDLVFNWYAP